MRFSNSTGRLNPNLLYSPFKKVEDFEKETQDIREIEKKYTHRKTPSLSLKKRSSRKLIEIPQLGDDFNNLSLERQVEVMMRPITNPGKKAENLLRLMEDEENSKHSSKETEKLTLETDDLEINSRFGARNILQEIKYQSSSVKATKSAKESISLPPLKDNDPLFTTQTAKHWHYHEPIKHTPRNLRGSINNVDVSNSMQKPTMETKFSLDKSKIFFSQSKSRLKTKNLVVLNSEVSVQRNIEINNTSSSSRFHKHREISLSTKRKHISNENLFANVTPNNHKTSRLLGQLDDQNMFYIEGIADSKGVNNAQEASNEVNHLLDVIPLNQDSQPLGGKRIDLNQIRTQNLQTNNEKRSSRLGFEEDMLGLSASKIEMSKLNLNGSKLQTKGLNSQVVNRKGAQTPSKKKEYYNRWFVPVKFWKASKEQNTSEKKIEELKKDANYFYHNLHNYASQPSSRPNKDQAKKTDLQINYEALQEKLKQNITIKRYKKQLAENGERIPNFLKNVEEDISTANK